MSSCNCNDSNCVHLTANQSPLEPVGRQFAFLGPPTQAEQDENSAGGISFFIPYTYNASLTAADVVITGSNPTGLSAAIRANDEGITSILVTTPAGTVFAPGTYASIFTVFAIATTVTIYGELQ